ncbi:MAG: hypothetical protein ACYDHO_02285 [Gaiellaceae bacterium]
MSNLLFRKGSLGSALEAQTQRMREAVESEPEESLKQADAGEWAAALYDHFAVRCPSLKTSEITRDPPQDIEIDVSSDPSRYFSAYSDYARRYPGYRITIHIPFDGDENVFYLKPSTFTTTYPRGHIKGSDLLLTLEYAQDTKPNIDGEVQSFVGRVNQYLDWARTEIDSFNSSLEQRAMQAIEARRRRIEERDAHLATSGIPVRRSGSTKTYIPDVLIRRPAPSLPRAKIDGEPPRLEPVLREDVFEHILEVIRRQMAQIEKSPGAFALMGEEDRRHIILSMLNTHYKGLASAEAFNNKGHTDILIRHEDKNLFICECKFWSGQEGFTGTIDQLFGYAGWRDTKLAIVMFVREKALTALLKKARAALGRHPQFVSWKDSASETELRATIRWPGDNERLADLNVFFIHTPQTQS